MLKIGVLTSKSLPIFMGRLSNSIFNNNLHTAITFLFPSRVLFFKGFEKDIFKAEICWWGPRSK